jgi:hypothetical protein
LFIGTNNSSQTFICLLIPAGTIELIKDRHDLQTVFGIRIHVLSRLEPRAARGIRDQVFLQFFYLLGQILGSLSIFLPINPIELITEIEYFAIGLGREWLSKMSGLLAQIRRLVV